MIELDVPAMVHVSASANRAFRATGAHYLNADTTAFMQLLQGDPFADLPECPDPAEHVLRNVSIDTCVYHHFDDARHYVDAAVPEADRARVYEHNARRLKTR